MIKEHEAREKYRHTYTFPQNSTPQTGPSYSAPQPQKINWSSGYTYKWKPTETRSTYRPTYYVPYSPTSRRLSGCAGVIKSYY